MKWSALDYGFATEEDCNGEEETRPKRSLRSFGEIFYTVREAQIVIEDWRQHYNRVRPHSSLGYRPPAPEVVAWPAERPQGLARPAIALRPRQN